MAMKKKGLGKGLNAIFAEKPLIELTQDESAKISEVPLHLIVPNPYQPRIEFDPEEIEELALSIENQGLIQPISLRKHDDKYQIIAGERRFRAHQKLGKTVIQAIVHTNLSNKQMTEWAIVENIQRVELSSIEEAKAYQRLIQEHEYRHEDVGKILGKSRSVISNTMRLLNLPETVQSWVHEGKLSAGHARNLLKPDITDPEKLALKWIQEGTSVRQAEASTPKTNTQPSSNKPKIESRDPNIVNMERELMYALGTNVRLQIKKNRGHIEIDFENWDDLDRIAKMIESGSQHL